MQPIVATEDDLTVRKDGECVDWIMTEPEIGLHRAEASFAVQRIHS